MLYIFDKDGTLIGMPDPNQNRPPNTSAEQVLLPGVYRKLAQLRADGHKIALASNQGGVAWGFLSLEQADKLMRDCAEKIGGVSAYAFSPYDPKAAAKNLPGIYARDDESRKPQPGMILALASQLGFDLLDVVFVGDHASDRQAAANAGCRFVWASGFFWNQ
jgi:HAD superfamily hydrolase (TIGR01662 family)